MKNKQQATPFFTKLKAYAEGHVIAMDVPGHKLGKLPDDFSDYVGNQAMSLDSNAPRGLDNLSHPKGVLKEAQMLAALAYQADHAYFLTNGTSQGIITMIMAVCKAKEKIIMPRNVHKSAINALILSGAIPVFVQPDIDHHLGIANGVSYETIEKAITENPDAKAVFIINPTYFGVVSDLERIVELAHYHGMLVLVDEAHGAHFCFNRKLPKSGIQAKADIVACSTHKTLGSLTMSSMLLTKGNRFDQRRLKSTINILQSTSPSSLLMASLDSNRKYVYFHANQRLEQLMIMTEKLRKDINQIDGLNSFGKDYFVGRGANHYDSTKIIVKVSDLGITGFEAYKWLFDEMHIQLELAETNLILAVLSIATTQDDIDYFLSALKKMSVEMKREKTFQAKIKYAFPEAYTRPRSAYHAPKKDIKLKDALGEIAGESIMIYPPGIPLLIPGEVVSKEVLKTLAFYEKQGSTVLSDSNKGYIRVVDKENWVNFEGEEE